MKNILIISPYFPPSNAADAQRIRMSLPFFKDFGWRAEVVAVHPKHSDIVKDQLLCKTIPSDIKVHYIGALSKKWTSKFGLGSIALRSLWFYFSSVNKILKASKFDLIYFSTTQFPVCILGGYWKKRFKIPYVIDMQDPWHSTYYLDKPQNERPPKYWFSYHLNRLLEPMAMKHVDGLIAVSDSYITQLKARYKNINQIPSKTITFGYLTRDFEICKESLSTINNTYIKSPGKLNLVYVGRGGYDMRPAVELLFTAFKELLNTNYRLYSAFNFHFIGTSYASSGEGKQTIFPIAEAVGVNGFVRESTDRVSYFENLKCLIEADGLIIPGSNDASYTASKIYPYILTEKPLLAIFNSSSSAYDILKKAGGRTVADLNNSTDAVKTIQAFLHHLVSHPKATICTDWEKITTYSAKSLTGKQCKLFNSVLENSN